MKSLHIAMTALGAVFLSLGTPPVAQAQFRTPPTIDGASSLAEYGNVYASPNGDDPELAWRMTWDDTNLYIAIEDANLQQGAALYLDIDPQIPVNTTGRLTGFNNYLGTNGNLPIEADIVIYAEKFYREFRRYNREGGGAWGSPQEWGGTPNDNNPNNDIGAYKDNGGEDGDKWSDERPETNFSGTVKEFSLPWSVIGVLSDPANPNSLRKRPENFNWFGHIHYGYDELRQDDPNTPEDEYIPNDNAGGIYGQVPRGNENGDRQNTIPEKGRQYVNFNWTRYFSVLNTAAGSDGRAFGPNGLDSYSHTGPYRNFPDTAFPGISVYDFTLNTPNATITRRATDATFDIQGSLVVNASTLDLSSSADPVTIARNLTISETANFSFQNTAATLRVGGDIAFAEPNSFQTNAEVILTGDGNQLISGDTYRALRVEGTGTKTLTDRDLTITSALTLPTGTLATGANKVILANTATLSETGGYLLGDIQTSRTLAAQSAEEFGGIGLTITPSSGSDVTVQRITGGFGVNGSLTDSRATKTIRRRFFITSDNAQPTTGTLEFDYRTLNPNELEGNDPSTLKLYRSTDRTASYAVVEPGTNQNTPNTAPNTNTLTFEGPLALNNSYYSLSSDNVPLPVELISFTGKAENNAVRLNWATASELQNKGFEIQRRTNVGEWKSIGFVAGNGTTNQRHDYTYLDRLALAGIPNYYRLRQVDLDGKSVYSQPVTVQLRGTSAVAFSVSPVPTTDVLTLNGLSAGKHVVEIYNARGQRVMSKEIAESAAFTFSVRALPVGVYMVRVLGANRGVQNARFIKQ